MWWHPYGKAMLPEHITVVHPSSLPWASDSYTMYLDQALIYNWLDQANMYHVMMETGNFIYATACKLLGACTHATSHYQILSTMSNKHKLSICQARCDDAAATFHISSIICSETLNCWHKAQRPCRMQPWCKVNACITICPLSCNVMICNSDDTQCP
ncbi:TPA: hypothetical protein ACH3X2_005097 [Trebouxia sp. C0005]